MTTINFSEKATQTHTGNSGNDAAVFTFRDKQTDPNHADLTPQSEAILEIAQEVGSISNAELKKKTTTEMPEKMGWSTEETGLFHSFLKDIALEQEKEALRQKEEETREILGFGKTLTKFGRTVIKGGVLATLGFVTLNVGVRFAEKDQLDQGYGYRNISQQAVSDMKDFFGKGADYSALGTFLAVAATLSVGASNMHDKRKLSRIDKKTKELDSTKKDNAIIQQQLQRLIKQDGKA